MDSIHQNLYQRAGVQPSQHWLEDCCNELQLTGNEDRIDSAVLQQVLYHDLRDVICVFEPVSVDPNSPAVLLRRALQESQTSQSKKATLPESFRLMVQVEEFLDVSLNAEARLAVGPASRDAPAAVGNQRNRCLKLAMSDGYTSTGSPYYTENDSPHFTLIAMEITPIQNLSVNSNAGIKVLMRGPIVIRHGVLFWHPGNATVLGGKVPELVELQVRALEQAKLRAGVGVDPTIKALIWNAETGEMEEGTLIRVCLFEMETKPHVLFSRGRRRARESRRSAGGGTSGATPVKHICTTGSNAATSTTASASSSSTASIDTSTNATTCRSK